MIEFKFLIHKPTDSVVDYNRWLELLKEDNVDFYFQKPIRYNGELDVLNRVETNRYNYQPKDMIFSDDFKIIYKHDLAFNELREIHNSLMIQGVYDNPLTEKVNELIDNIYKNEIRYNLDI